MRATAYNNRNHDVRYFDMRLLCSLHLFCRRTIVFIIAAKQTAWLLTRYVKCSQRF
jgi:hypothetical protein